MKKLLLGSLALTTFSISILIFQISCKKEATAQTGSNYTLPPATTSTLGGVIVGSGLNVTANGTLSLNSSTTTGLTQLNKIVYQRFDYLANKPDGIWIANYDGTNQTKINITIPGLTNVTLQEPRLSPDGKIVFFGVYSHEQQWDIYSSNVDGTNLKRIINGGNGQYEIHGVGGAY